MIVEDHSATPNWGNKPGASAFRARERAFLKLGDYEGLIQMEVDALENTPDPEGYFANLKVRYTYDGALQGCIEACEELFGIR